MRSSASAAIISESSSSLEDSGRARDPFFAAPLPSLRRDEMDTVGELASSVRAARSLVLPATSSAPLLLLPPPLLPLLLSESDCDEMPL